MLRLLTIAAIGFPLALANQDAGIALESPRDYQVFQRETRQTGRILVRGSAPVGSDQVEARIGSGAWVRMEPDPASHEFSNWIGVKPGGFLAVTVRAQRGSALLAEAVVAHVGVGEVFVIAGQSNATNYGEIRQQSKSRMVSAFDGKEWRLADDPQPGVQDNSTKGSFIPAFGDAMYEAYGVPIGVACVGHGSTSVRQWLPKGEAVAVQPTMTRFVSPLQGGGWESDGTLFNGLAVRMRELGPNGFRAVLWHQGESDANQKAGHQISGEDYYQMMVKVIRAAKQAAGWDVPWFVAQASYHTPDDIGSAEIRAAQKKLWQDRVALEGPDTDKLGSRFREKNGTGVHFNVEGLQAHGKLWAEKVVEGIGLKK